MPHAILITFADLDAAARWAAQTELPASAKWVAVSPNSEYDNEYACGDINLFDAAAESVAEVINGQYDADWPAVPFADWPLSSQRELVKIAVDCGYLGPNSAHPPAISDAWNAGRFANLPRAANPTRMLYPTAASPAH